MKKYLIYFFIPASLFAKCDFDKVPKELLPLVQTIKDAEKLTLSDPLPKSFASKSEEFVFRARTKNWKGFDWMLRPSEVSRLLLAQEKYMFSCETAPKKILSGVAADFKAGKIPKEDKKKFMRLMLLVMPCSEGDDSKALQTVAAGDFNKNTENFISLLVATESEAPQFAADYKACEANELGSKFILTDNFMRGFESYLNGSGVDKTLILRLKRLRVSQGHFETAKYLFEKLEKTLGI